MRRVSSWGRLSDDAHDVICLADRGKVAGFLALAKGGVARGMGRSYGDVCLNSGGVLWSTTGLDRLISFDDVSGKLVCEAGMLLQDIQRLMVRRGWMLPVTPGTQLVTVGGAIANDVHGKNHHSQGTFGEHVDWMKLVRTDGEIIECGPANRADWFAATVGGLGLTGVIVEAQLQLRKVAGPWLDTETVPYRSLGEFFDLADACSQYDWEHTVSWVDCAGGTGVRGLFMRGNSTPSEVEYAPKDHTVGVPWVAPFSLINRFSLRPLNAAYFFSNVWRQRRRVAHYEAFLYPLDNLRSWNRIYGPKGFFQYQCVIPTDFGIVGVQRLLDAIADSGEGSFLSVLKTFGDRPSVGMLSFPQPGVTFALDFPNLGSRTHKLFARLDAIVGESGGRLYLAKDARMPRDLFEAGYPRLAEFLTYRDPGISSGMSRRLMGS
jgi:FAD/FMN-containing dehydrogenase